MDTLLKNKCTSSDVRVHLRLHSLVQYNCIVCQHAHSRKFQSSVLGLGLRELYRLFTLSGNGDMIFFQILIHVADEECLGLFESLTMMHLCNMKCQYINYAYNKEFFY